MIRKSLNERFDSYVWVMDGAVDKENPKAPEVFREFLKTRDRKVLDPILKGTPAEFSLGCLTRAQVAWVDTVSDRKIARDVETVAYGLRSVRGFEVEVDGVSQQIVLEFDETQQGRRVKSAYLDKIYDEDLFAELAARIREITRIDPTRGQG